MKERFATGALSMEVGFKLIGGAMAPAAPGLGIPEKKMNKKWIKSE